MKYTLNVNANSYKEVALNYRIFRTQELDAKNIGTKENRHVCPMVEAGRSKDAYQKQFISGLKSNNLKSFADALEVSPIAMKTIAYFSGNKSSIIGNIILGKFDDEAIKNGFIHTLKKGVHTGIYKEGKFSQEGFDNFVWAFHPNLKGVSFTNDWLYSSKADSLYLDDTHLDVVLAYNQTNKTTEKVGLGVKLSAFEMEKLLLGLLGQELKDHGVAKRGILVRDVYDLYKYGFVPATVEAKFEAENLIALTKREDL